MGTNAWLVDTRGADGQAAAVQFETGMGEAPEARLPKLIPLCSMRQLRKPLPDTVCSAVLAGASSCIWLTTCVWFAALQALDMCVRLMLRGEVAGLTSSWHYAYEGREDAPEVCSGDVIILYTCGLQACGVCCVFAARRRMGAYHG